jgi:hypothetical protein
MPIRFRKRLSTGPIRWNLGRGGLTSWSLKLGRWSWNSRTRRQRIDLPGPFSWEEKR